jgi:hypothetical protein
MLLFRRRRRRRLLHRYTQRRDRVRVGLIAP